MVELHIVDFIRSFGLESLVDESELMLSDLELQEIKDGSESGVRYESTVTFILNHERKLNLPYPGNMVSSVIFCSLFQFRFFQGI